MCVETTQVTQQIRGGRPLGAGTTGGGGCWGVLWWGGGMSAVGTRRAPPLPRRETPQNILEHRALLRPERAPSPPLFTWRADTGRLSHECVLAGLGGRPLSHSVPR